MMLFLYHFKHGVKQKIAAGSVTKFWNVHRTAQIKKFRQGFIHVFTFIAELQSTMIWFSSSQWSINFNAKTTITHSYESFESLEYKEAESQK